VNAVTYYRVSTKAQGRSGLGLEAQRSTVESYLQVKDAHLLDEVVEIESGGKNDRPQLERALRRCRLAKATLVVAKLDRLSRDVEFIHRLQREGVDFVCADMPEANTLTIGLLAVLAQHERELISTRTKDALAAAKARGVRLGNPRLAECANTDSSAARRAHIAIATERNAELSAVIREIEEEHGKRMTLQALADVLNDREYKTARGKSFTRTTVARLRSAAQRS